MVLEKILFIFSNFFFKPIVQEMLTFYKIILLYCLEIINRQATYAMDREISSSALS